MASLSISCGVTLLKINSFKTEGGKKKEKTMPKNVPNLIKSINPQAQEIQQTQTHKNKSHRNQSAHS